MDHTLQATLWRLVPPPAARVRLIAVLLMVVLVLVFGRGMLRYLVVPVAAVAMWIGFDVLFSASLGHVYRLVARSQKARFHPDPFPRGPRAEWTEGFGPTPAAKYVLGPIASGYAGRVARTRLLINDMRALPASLEITAGRAPTMPGQLLDVPAGAGPELRARMPASRAEAGRAEEFLDAYTTERIRELAARAGAPGLRIRVSPQGVLVDVGRVLRRYSSLQLLVEIAKLVRDRALTLAKGGDVKLGAEAPRVVATPDGGTAAQRACAVCFEAMEGLSAPKCKACGAAHHRDCFEWTGHCGAFSCPGAELVSA